MQQRLHTLQLVHLFQTDRGRDPDEADERSDLLLHPDRVAGHVQAGDGSLEGFGAAVVSVAVAVAVAVATGDAEDRVFHVAVVLLFHGFGELALALAGGTVLAEDVAGEDLDLRDEMPRVVGVLEHCVDEVVFVAGGPSDSSPPASFMRP